MMGSGGGGGGGGGTLMRNLDLKSKKGAAK